MSQGSRISTHISRHTTQSRRRHATQIIGLAALALCASGARAQFYNIADLGLQFGAPIAMEGGSGAMLIPDATTGQIYGLQQPLQGFSFSTFPVPTPLNQLATGNLSYSTPTPQFNSSTQTFPTVWDAFTSQGTSLVTGSRIAGTFTGTDGNSHVFEYYNPVLDGQSPPTQVFDTIFSDVGTLAGHEHDILTVTGFDEFDNLTGYAFDPNTGVTTPFAKYLNFGVKLQVAPVPANVIPTGIGRSIIVGNAIINGDVHGFYSSIDLGAGIRVNGISEAHTIVGTMAVGLNSHAFMAPVVNDETVNERPGTLIDLGTLGGANSFGEAVRTFDDEAIGQAQTGSGAFHAFLDFLGQPMVDLNSLLSPADQAHWVLVNATTIDSGGDIGGLGLFDGVQHGFFLSQGGVLTNPNGGNGSLASQVSVLTTAAQTRVLQTNSTISLVVPITTTVQLTSNTGANLPAPYTLTASGSPSATFQNSNTSTDGGFLNPFPGQTDTHFGQVDLTGITTANYTGTVTFSAPGSNILDVPSNFNIQIFDPANVSVFSNTDAQGNQTQVEISNSPSSNLGRTAADAQIEPGTIFITPGWTQVGNAIQDGAVIPNGGPDLIANFTFNSAHASNGLHYGYVTFVAQNDQTLFGASTGDLGQMTGVLTFNVINPVIPHGGSYAGLQNSFPFNTGTIATLLDGSVGDNPGAAVGPGTGSPVINIAANGNPNIDSEIVTLSGTNGDIVVLQLSFANFNNDPNAADFALLYDPTNSSFAVGGGVELAVDGNTSGSFKNFVIGAYDPNVDFKLGTYGVDLVNDVAWAVIDHNSEFAVGPVSLIAVPEPASIVSAGFLASLALVRRRRNRSTQCALV